MGTVFCMKNEEKNIYTGLGWQTVSSTIPKILSPRHLPKSILSRGTYNHRKSLLHNQLTVRALNTIFYKGELQPTVCRGCRELSPMAKAAPVSAESFSFPFLICAKCASPHTRFSTHPEVHHVSLGPSNPAVRRSGNARGTSARLSRSRLVDV